MQTQMLRQQHQEILDLLQEIGKIMMLGESGLATKAAEVRGKLVSLTGKVTVHLSAEDKSLYPKLLEGKSAPPAQVASLFAQEMGSLAGAYKEFISRWPTGDAIAGAPRKFIDECGGVAKALTTRIQREEKELYPLLDAMP